MPAHLIAEDGPLQGLILDLEDGDEWIIGRSTETADLVVNDSTVSRKHAKISRVKNGLALKNISKVNPTLINNEEHREPVLLKEGDRVLIGETTFLFSEENIPKLKSAKKKTKPKKPNYDDIFEELESPEKEAAEESFSLEETVQSNKTPPENEKEEQSSYDTLFEDVAEDADLPFNLPPDTPYLLKVISGPNAGAEIGMQKEHTYTLGKEGQTCDIIFQDLSVSRTHARLSISADGVIEIEDLGSKNGTAVNGVLITEKQVISSQDIISLGTTIFLIIDREAPQETIYSALVPSHLQEKNPTSEAEKTEAKEKKTRDWKKEPIPFKHLIVIGSIAAVFLIAFVSFFSLFKSKEVEIVHKEPASQIQEALASTKFCAIEFTFNPASGKLFLVGHVLTAVDYQEMRYQLDQIPFITSIEDTVVIDDGVSKIMNDVISANNEWKGISIRAMTPGKFIVSGYLQTNLEMTQISEYLTVNFPYLDRLENKIAVEENLNVQIGGILMSSGFGAVTYQLNNGEVVLRGLYDQKKEKEYKEFLKHVKSITSITSVKNFAVPVNDNMAAINLTSQYQVTGITLFDSKGYNAIINGKIYTLGDTVNGMDIINIEDDTILLEKDGVKYKIDYTR